MHHIRTSIHSNGSADSTTRMMNINVTRRGAFIARDNSYRLMLLSLTLYFLECQSHLLFTLNDNK